MRFLSLASVVALALAGHGAFAAQHLVPTQTLLVKNPPSGARKVLWKVSDSTINLVGDAINQGGATLRIVLTPGGDQCVSMPAGGWTTIGSIGFKYKDSTLANGPVKVAFVKETPSGLFKVKALLKTGGPTAINVVPGNPTTTYALNLKVGTGDEYCGGTSFVTPNPNNATTFKVSNDGNPASCVAACTLPMICGDGMVVGTEQCDDGNTLPGDGCDANCLPEETTSQSVGGGGVVDSDDESNGATAADPLETRVTTPNGGTVTIVETSPSGAPSGFELRGQVANITAPNASTSSSPLELLFTIDASQIRPGEDESTVQVFRNGVLVGPCLGAPGTAVPEPCVAERTLLVGGDVQLRVYATHTSPWSFGYPLCGNGVLDGSEACDPPAGSCGGGQTCKSDCTCAAVCDCCAGAPTTLTITHGAAAGVCGSVTDLNGMLAFNLTCNSVYFGGGGAAVPPFPLGDGQTVLDVTSCDSASETLKLGPTTSIQTGNIGTCTTAGCRFGAPMAVPNPGSTPTSSCVVPVIAQDVFGVASCGGVIDQLPLPISAEVFLTGDTSTDSGSSIPGIQSCPLCSAGACIGGPNNGMACTPGNPAINAGYPTSNDCPPTASNSIGFVSAGLALTTGVVNWTATLATNDVPTTASVQSRVFAGYCRDVACPGCTGAFESPAHQCWENGLAVGTPCGSGGSTFESCEQRNHGAFGPNGNANTTISAIGSTPGCLADELPHASRVVGPIRFPPTYDPTIDAAADFPGPGTMTLDGNMQVQ